jgi:hypothetical protein
MVLCDNDLDPFDFQSQCVREIWGSFLPAGLVLVLCFLSIPIPHALDILCSPFKTFLTLHEAETLDGNIDKISSQDDMGNSVETVPLWRTVVFVFGGIIQCISWIAHGLYRLHNDPRDILGGLLPFLVAIAWLYTIIRPISHPIATSPFDLFSIYLVLFCVGSLRIGGIFFDHNVFSLPWPSTITLVALSANLLALLVLLIVVLNTPLTLPSNRINKKDIVSYGLLSKYCVDNVLLGLFNFSRELHITLGMDYIWLGLSTYSKGLSFLFFFEGNISSHRFPQGRYTTLNEPDVWNLSPTMQSRPIFVKFRSVRSVF